MTNGYAPNESISSGEGARAKGGRHGQNEMDISGERIMASTQTHKHTDKHARASRSRRAPRGGRTPRAKRNGHFGGRGYREQHTDVFGMAIYLTLEDELETGSGLVAILANRRM